MEIEVKDRRSKARKLLEEVGIEGWRKLIDQMSPEEVLALEYSWEFWARPDQLPPEGDWDVWLFLGGRGSGKTRAGAEWVIQKALESPGVRIGLIGPTLHDVRETMIRGESGILSCIPPWVHAHHESKSDQVLFENGSICYTYSSEASGRLRGPQHHYVWGDEVREWRSPMECWANIEFGLRLGKHPQAFLTTSPRPMKLLRDLLSDSQVVVTRASLYDNMDYVAPSFMKRVMDRYDGTRLGRQEIWGEMLELGTDALWDPETIDTYRVYGDWNISELEEIVIGVDPGQETGIIVAGRKGKHVYVLEDGTISGGAKAWPGQVVGLYRKYGANPVVVERNHGGDMVRELVQLIDPSVSIEMVWASMGKAARAEPVVWYYDQGLVHHVGYLSFLEDELYTWEPGRGTSPNRLDALVWAVTWLVLRDRASRSREEADLGIDALVASYPDEGILEESLGSYREFIRHRRLRTE